MKTILAVDDSVINLKSITKYLSGKHKVVAVSSAKDGFTYLENHRPDLILLDILMPEMDGFEMMEIMRNDGRYKDIPVIFLTADDNKENELRGLRMGAMDFIVKPFEPDIAITRINKALELDSLRHCLEEEVASKTRELEVMQVYASEAKEEANKDVLTGLWNRRYIEKEVNDYLSEPDAKGAIFMIDIDDFKGINDRYGHIFGDEILINIANTIIACIREDDIACRIGGDEFYVFLRGINNVREVSSIAKELLKNLNENVKYPDTNGSVGASIGIAIAKSDGNDFESLYSNADKALYHTKNNGKNNFHFYSKEVNRNMEHDSTQEDLDYIRKLLTEDNVSGSYLVEYEGFKNIARFIQRNVERNGKEVVYILFTLDNVKTDKISPDDINPIMHKLESSIKNVLRIGDVTTRYSNKQMIVILMNAGTDDAVAVAERVKKDFDGKAGLTDLTLRYDIQNI